MPMELSKIMYYFEKDHGGTIKARVTNEKFQRSTRADGLVIKCRYLLACDDSLVMNKTFMLIKRAIRELTEWRIRLSQL